MVSLKKKTIKGHIYWYAVEMARVDGKPKQVWQKYLGTAEKIVELKEKTAELSHIKLKSFQYGKTAALLSISNELNFIETVNKHDAKIFPDLLDTLTKRLTNLKVTTEDMILVFDKGNNSQVNIEDTLSKMHIVASAKHNQAEELMDIPLKNYCFY